MNRSTSYKIPFLSSFIWKKLFLIRKNKLFHPSGTIVKTRSSTIPRVLVNRKAFIYTGRKFRFRFLTKWSVGFKFGEFTWNRRLALYKAKQLRKKKKKK